MPTVTHESTVARVDKDWRKLRNGTRRMKYLIELDDPFRMPTPKGAAVVQMYTVESWSPLAASLCERAVYHRFAVRIRAHSTPWGLELASVERIETAATPA
jgi:hypothetical protein